MRIRFHNGIPFCSVSASRGRGELYSFNEVPREVLSHMQAEFSSLLNGDAVLKACVTRLVEGGSKAVVFGGWARDRAIEVVRGQSIQSRDIDMVTDGVIEISAVVGREHERNVFGGFGVAASRIHLDIWSLQETFLIKKNGLPKEFESLLATTDFFCNSIIFFPEEIFGEPFSLEQGAIASIRDGVIGFCAEEIPIPELQVVRVLVTSIRLGLSIPDEVKRFISDICSDEGRLCEVEESIKKFCPPDYVAGLRKVLGEIRRYPINR